MLSHGMAADPVDGMTQVTFGDQCPSCADGIAVHQAMIAMIDDGGDIVLPTYYAVCCDCHRAQYIKKYGIENLLPCGCENVSLAKVALLQRDAAAARADALTAEGVALAAWREKIAGELSNA